MIKRTVRTPAGAPNSITSGVRNRNANMGNRSAVMASLTPAQKAFVGQIRRNYARKANITAATNTSNIMARPDFLELLPIFVQKLIVLDVFGSVAMRSRQQLIPYFKFIAENTKGETKAGTVLASPFANRQGADPNFTGKVVKNELVAEGDAIADDGNKVTGNVVYLPVLPGSVTVNFKKADGTIVPFVDDGKGEMVAIEEGGRGSESKGYINYSTGEFSVDTGESITKEGASVTATYQYDNETVGPHTQDNLAHGQYGAFMGKGYLQLDEINLVAEARELACYWSIYSAFAAQEEYGANIGDIAKEAAFGELTAEINSYCLNQLKKAASYKPQFNWDAAPVLSSSVVPSDYLNMFKLKLSQAAASVYQATRLARPNRLIVGTNAAEYIGMINGFVAAPNEENVGPYKFGTLDQFEVYVAPDYDPNEWVMSTKSTDIRRCSGLYGEYMPLTNTDAIGLANASAQQGYATMFGLEIVNPATVVGGKIVGTY